MNRVLGVALVGLMLAGPSLAKSGVSLGLKSTPVTQGLRVAAPGFITVDGKWYFFNGPFSGPILLAFPFGPSSGFAVSAWASAVNCRNVPALPAAPSVPPMFVVQQGQTVLTSFPLAPGGPFGPEIKLGHCQGINIIAVASRTGQVVCDGQVDQPYTVQDCPVIARFDTRFEVFTNGFE